MNICTDIVQIISRKDYKIKVAHKKQYLTRFAQMTQFVTRLVEGYPYTEKSAWDEFQQLLIDNAADIMQAVQDLYTLGQEDWRFAVL